MGDVRQNTVERILDKMERGEITTAQGNVELILAERVRIVEGRIPSTLRKTLNESVKRGELGHMKKEGFKPEVYYNPTFEYLALSARNTMERESKRAIAKVAGFRD
jgi:hypothetical protein